MLTWNTFLYEKVLDKILIKFITSLYRWKEPENFIIEFALLGYIKNTEVNAIFTDRTYAGKRNYSV
ncbi:hypothetical protein AMS60_20285 [Bacillus sp. FJAT-21945]|nr:hypothetical protein AMS60_20285 [Bacillus sp. FJAT-21945]